jgi:hypothetical protein
MEVTLRDLSILDDILQSRSARIRCDLFALQSPPSPSKLELVILSGNKYYELPQILMDDKIPHSIGFNRLCAELCYSNATIFYSFRTLCTENKLKEYRRSPGVIALIYNGNVMKGNEALDKHRIKITAGPPSKYLKAIFSHNCMPS